MKYQLLLDYIGKHVTLNSEEESFLLSKLVYKKYLKRQYILQQGDVCKGAAFILSGCTKVFFVNKEGHEHIVGISVEEWWTTDLESFLYQTPSDYNAQCIEDTEVIQFMHDTMEELYEAIPKLERFWRKMMERAYIASKKRILRAYTLTAKERYLIFRKSYPKIEQRIPQYLVASYLGFTKEFLSKIKSDLSKEQ